MIKAEDGNARKVAAAATVFPLLSAAELAELADDIRANGLIHPIVLWSGEILDGRNRLAACRLAGVEPRFEEYSGHDPLAYVIGANLRRRHLDASQLAMVGDRVATMRQGSRTDLASIEARSEVSQSEAAAMVGVSRSAIQRAHVVHEHGTPELVAAVDAGEVAVSVAARVAQLPAEKQAEVLGAKVDATGTAEDKMRRRDAVRRAVKEASRQQHIAEIVKKAEPLTGRFAVLYADPPWRYEFVETESRAIENQYPTMVS